MSIQRNPISVRMSALLSIILVAAILFVVGCGSDGGTNLEPVPQTPSQTVEYEAKEVVINGMPCIAVVSHNGYGDITSIDCDWSSRDGEMAP